MKRTPLYTELLRYTDKTSATRISQALVRRENIDTKEKLVEFMKVRPYYSFAFIGDKYEKVLECVIDEEIEIPAERLEVLK